MSQNFTRCECGKFKRAEFKVCYDCHKKQNMVATVVYDLGGGKEAQEEYFKNNPGQIPFGLLPKGVVPDEDFNEVYASDLLKAREGEIL